MTNQIINNNEELALMNNFRLPDVNSAGEFSSDDLSEDMDGLQMSFPKIKIPSGGTLQFEIPSDDPENPDYTKTLEGIILFNHSSSVYWQEGSEYDDNATPLCSSFDGKQGSGNPGGTCATCPFNEFGSGKDGKGKACKNMRVIYFLRDGDYLPIQINLPPTSIRPFTDFYSLAFGTRRRASYGSVVQIALKRMNNGNDYSVATFKKLFDFSGNKLTEVQACATAFREQIKIMQQQRTVDAENREEIVYSESGYVIDEAGESFNISDHTLNGDRDELPA